MAGRRSRSAGRSHVPSGPIFEIGAVAGALEEPRSLLKSWAEQDILRPAAAAQGTGTRRWFDRETAVKAGILVEVRRLLGHRFRPGEIGKVIAGLDAEMIDRKRDREPVLLVIYRAGEAFAVTYMEPEPTKLAHLTKRHAGLLLINLTAINTRLWDALDA